MKCLLCGHEIKETEYKESITQTCTHCSWQCTKPKKSNKDESDATM